MLMTIKNIEAKGFRRKSLCIWVKGDWYYFRCPDCNRFSANKKKMTQYRTEDKCAYCGIEINFASKRTRLAIVGGDYDG
jgi:hypothetical protein